MILEREFADERAANIAHHGAIKNPLPILGFASMLSP